MANPTTNFGWVMPTSSSLVTNLPADFNTFGQAVDTSMSELLGGTTGQVLSKTSNTNMDFTWVTPSSGMTNPMTTTGDTIYSSSGSTPARLGIGSTGQVLTVAGGIPSWATASAPTQNFALINSGGTALSGSGTTTISVSGKNQLFIRVLSASAVGAYCVLWVRFNSDSGSNYGYIRATASDAGGATWTGFEQGTADTELQVGQGGSSASNNISLNLLVSGANAAGYKPINFSSSASGTGAVMATGNAWYSGTSAITSVSIISSGQNFDAGTVFVYGA